jgi:hypothetical protein
LPTVSFVVPNLNDDMHDGTIAQGDTWLQQHMNAYIQFAQTHNSLLIITWDEDDSSMSNQIPTIFIGQNVKQGQFSEHITHFNVLRTIEDLYGLTHAGAAANATPITDVFQTAATPAFTLSASPASVSVTQGSTASSTITTAVSGGFNSSINLTVSGLPAGVTAVFNPAPIPAPGSGTSTITFTASSTAALGTANVTIMASGGGITHTTTIALTVNSSTPADFTITDSPSSITVRRGTTGTSTVTIGALNGFAGTVSLSVSGQGSRVTPTFNPTSVTGSGSSTLSVRVGNRATTGTRTLTITGTSGSLTHSVTLTLTIQ